MNRIVMTRPATAEPSPGVKGRGVQSRKAAKIELASAASPSALPLAAFIKVIRGRPASTPLRVKLKRRVISSPIFGGVQQAVILGAMSLRRLMGGA